MSLSTNLHPAQDRPTCDWTKAASGVVLLCLVGTARADALADLWAEARRDGEYRAADRQELRDAEDLFLRTLRGKEEFDALKKAWSKLDFELLVLKQEKGAFWVLRESAKGKTGRGFYVMRRGQAPDIVIEAPHSGADVLTGTLALLLFQESRAGACAWNSVPRSGVDLAHEPESYYQSFTAALARAQPRGLVVQLHGFDGDKRKTEAAGNADVIFSNGTRRPPLWLLALSKAVKDAADGTFKIFPTDVKELGGTTNAQAKLLASMNHDGFLHLEMSLAWRKRLREDAKLRQALLQAVNEVYQKERANPEPEKEEK